MKYILPGAFITDIITNSSSSVYSFARSPEVVYEMLNSVMSALGIKDKKAEDIFTIEIMPDLTYAVDYLNDAMYTPSYMETEEEKLEHVMENLGWYFSGETVKELYNLSLNSGYDALDTYIIERAERDEKFRKGLIEYFGDREAGLETSYVICTKDGNTEIGKLLDSLFNLEVRYD